MTRLDHATYLDHLRADSARLREALTTADPDAPVPACPGWTAADLLWHHAEVLWFWNEVISRRPGGPPEDGRRERAGSLAGLVEQHAESAAALVATLEQADPAEPAWSWAPEQTVGFTFRRQAHEALIHRLDAEQTVDVESVLDPVLAADGVAELLEVMYGGEPPAWARIEAADHHVRIDLTDTGTSLWAQPCTLLGTHPETGRVYDGPHVLLVGDPGGAPDAVITGRACDLDAWLWKRRDREGIALEGDPLALERFEAAVSPDLD
ncbi:maleylpyruvate isomerase N-terminal domain-containing protein [Nocardioides sp. GXZ039]|uniref:maleylpyruvate isomerase N-terminal domain-containing protein n=1 Tax=Nocardioides sp. GXZ039 TaxID=3136018 RepID=UPI0030F3F132